LALDGNFDTYLQMVENYFERAVVGTVDILQEQGTKVDHTHYKEIPEELGFEFFGEDEMEKSYINWQNYYNFTDIYFLHFFLL
jgi:hypothetical protein